MIQFELVETDRALFENALRFAKKQVRTLLEIHPDYYPLYTDHGKWKHQGQAWTHWCDGFLPGMMWIFQKRAEKGSEEAAFWLDRAVHYTKPLEPRKLDRDVHDLAFIFLSTDYRWYRLTKDSKLNEVLIQAGKTLAMRYQEKGQYLSSFISANSLFIDIMMNVGIVFYAARETHDPVLREIALRHCHTTRRYLVRGDGSTAHEGLFDLDTGEFLKQTTHQGFRGDSCWSRGLAWSMYGFGTAYEYSRDPRFLNTAQSCADYYITHAPSDGVPPWDFNAPPERSERDGAVRPAKVDTSAGAIAAAGLLRLCRLLPDPVKGHFYWSTAIRILQSLCGQYLADSDTTWEGILKGGVYHIHKGLGVNESVMWGEYFFVEALEDALHRL